MVNTLLTFLEEYKNKIPTNDVWNYEEEIEFLHRAKELRLKYHDDPTFIDYENGSIKPTLTKTTSITGGSDLEDFALDIRRLKDEDKKLLDQEDYKIMKRVKKKR